MLKLHRLKLRELEQALDLAFHSYTYGLRLIRPDSWSVEVAIPKFGSYGFELKNFEPSTAIAEIILSRFKVLCPEKYSEYKFKARFHGDLRLSKEPTFQKFCEEHSLHKLRLVRTKFLERLHMFEFI